MAEVLGTCLPRHRHREFLRSLARIGAETPPERAIHLIVDNCAAHKHPRGKPG